MDTISAPVYIAILVHLEYLRVTKTLVVLNFLRLLEFRESPERLEPPESLEILELIVAKGPPVALLRITRGAMSDWAA